MRRKGGWEENGDCKEIHRAVSWTLTKVHRGKKKRGRGPSILRLTTLAEKKASYPNGKVLQEILLKKWGSSKPG